MDAVSPDLLSRNLSLEPDVAGDLPVIVADRAAMVQALVYILRCAVRFTSGNGGVVLKAWREGADLRVEVLDDAPPVSGELLARMTNPFLVPEADRLYMARLGMGFALAGELAAAHGGRIWVENRPQGNAFCLLLPGASLG